MNTITLAQTVLVAQNLRTAALWVEFDAAIAKLHGKVLIEHSSCRRYRLPAIDLRVSVAGTVISVIWLGQTPVLDTRSHIDLRQSADAWLDTLSALSMRPAPVSARVQAAASLLSAGFESVSVSSNGLVGHLPTQIHALAA